MSDPAQTKEPASKKFKPESATGGISKNGAALLDIAKYLHTREISERDHTYRRVESLIKLNILFVGVTGALYTGLCKIAVSHGISMTTAFLGVALLSAMVGILTSIIKTYQVYIGDAFKDVEPIGALNSIRVVLGFQDVNKFNNAVIELQNRFAEDSLEAAADRLKARVEQRKELREARLALVIAVVLCILVGAFEAPIMAAEDRPSPPPTESPAEASEPSTDKPVATPSREPESAPTAQLFPRGSMRTVAVFDSRDGRPRRSVRIQKKDG